MYYALPTQFLNYAICASLSKVHRWTQLPRKHRSYNKVQINHKMTISIFFKVCNSPVEEAQHNKVAWMQILISGPYESQFSLISLPKLPMNHQRRAL